VDTCPLPLTVGIVVPGSTSWPCGAITGDVVALSPLAPVPDPAPTAMILAGAMLGDERHSWLYAGGAAGAGVRTGDGATAAEKGGGGPRGVPPP
jgi:hypothetical protein